jgi:hypothetical protein
MILKFGKYKGMEISSVPHDYLQWIVNNFDDCIIKTEAQKILNSTQTKDDINNKTLEEQANEILGEKPIGLLRRGGRFKNR